MVARIPYPSTVPKYYAVASEVATMDYLRSSGLPVPRVYGYSPVSDNAAKTAFIIMELMKGTKLSDVWLELGESEIVSLLRQFTQLESQMMSISFPAGGSLYYAHDLEKVAKRAAIPFKDERFCVGPDTRPFMWYGRRSQLDVERGPYESANAVLLRAAHKELAYLEQFGQPLLPFQRIRREGYGYQEQSPSGHIENLNRYLIVSSLIPKDPAFGHFRIRHPDLQQSNILVSKSPDSGWQVVGLLDWQHTSILPLFLLTENFGELNESKQIHAKVLYRRHLVHHHYVKNTAEYNELLYAVLTDPVSMLLRRLFCLAGDPWEGETLELKVALIKATEEWDKFTGGGAPPCPVIFDAEDIRKTMELEAVQREADKTFQAIQAMVGFESESWVLTTRYDEAMVYGKQLKEKVLARVTSVKERAEIMAHWILDDIDETNYM